MLGYILAATCVLVTAPIWIIEHRRKSLDNIADDLGDGDWPALPRQLIARLEAYKTRGRKSA